MKNVKMILSLDKIRGAVVYFTTVITIFIIIITYLRLHPSILLRNYLLFTFLFLILPVVLATLNT